MLKFGTRLKNIGVENFSYLQNASTQIRHRQETHRSHQQIEVEIDRNNEKNNKIDNKSYICQKYFSVM